MSQAERNRLSFARQNALQWIGNENAYGKTASAAAHEFAEQVGVTTAMQPQLTSTQARTGIRPIAVMGTFCVLWPIGCGNLFQPKTLPEGNKAACRRWIDRLQGLPCSPLNGSAASGDDETLEMSEENRDMLCEQFSGDVENSPIAGCDLTELFDCAAEQFSCESGQLAIAGEIIDDSFGFAGFLVLVLPFENCRDRLDEPQCAFFDPTKPLAPP